MKFVFFKHVTILAVICASASVLAWTKDGENPWILQPKNVPITPHRKFANPLSGKVPHVLFSTMGQRLRDIQELAQRTECTYELWPWYKYSIFSPFGKEKLYAPVLNHDDYQSELAKMFSPRKLQTFDAIVFGKTDILLMPEIQRELILNQVRNGTQLFLFMMDSLPVPKIKGADFQDFPVDFLNQSNPYLKDVSIQKASFGKGAIFAICFPKSAHYNIKGLKGERYVSMETLTVVDSDHPLWYDYSMAFVGKLFLNVFNPDRIRIEKLNQDGSFQLSKLPPSGCFLRYEIVNRFNRDIFIGKQSVARQKIALPGDLPKSALILNVFLCDETEKVMDYASVILDPQPPAFISSVITDKEAYSAGEPVQITVQIGGKPQGILDISLKDDRGWIIAKKEIPAEKIKKTEIRFPYSGSHYAEVSAVLKDAKKILDEVHTDIYFKEVSDYHKDLRFIMWGGINRRSRVHNQAMKYYKNSGVDVLYDFSSQWATRQVMDSLTQARQFGFWFSVCLTCLKHNYKYQKRCNFSGWEMYRKTGKFKDSNGQVWNSQQRSIERIMTQLQNKYGVLFYSLGDEAVVGYGKELCYCPECLARFRIYVKRIYGNIEKLNKEYGTHYKSFDEVKGMPLEQAADAELIPMWIDYRLFTEEEFINWFRLCIDMIRQYDPQAIIGSEGYVYPERSISGFNFYKMFPYTGFGAFYLNERDHVAAQYFPSGAIAGAVLGAYEGLMNSGRLKYDVWFTLFEGFQSFFWWRNFDITTGFSNSADFGFMLQPLSQYETAIKEFSSIRNSGQGKLIISAQKHDDGIRIHYSNNCLHADTVAPDKNTWDGSLSDFRSVLYSLGFSYKYINQQELEAGVPEQVKMLILPYSQAMSDAEVTQVKNFVKRGGVLIADYNPAIFDEHGKERKVNPLLPVFGKFSRLNIHKYGKGHAVYLDNYLSGADARIKSNSATGIQEGMLRLFKRFNIHPFAEVTDNQNIRQKFKVFEKGSEKYICMIGPVLEKGAERTSKVGAEGGASSVTVGGSTDRVVQLSVPMHVYDLAKNGIYLGKTNRIQLNLEPSVGRILFCSPVPVTKPVIKLADKKVVYGKALSLDLDGFCNTAILKIYNPQGICVRETRVSPGKTQFVPAWNEPEGEYTAELVNIAGGLKTKVHFSVNKP